jgi:hypothetical protein
MPVTYAQAAQLSGVHEERQGTRRAIAIIAIAMYFGTLGLLVLVGWLGFNKPVNDIEKLLAVTAAVLGGVVGAVVGFYFKGENGS